MDLASTWDTLKAMKLELRKMRLDNPSREIFKEKLLALGVEYNVALDKALAISRNTPKTSKTTQGAGAKQVKINEEEQKKKKKKKKKSAVTTIPAMDLQETEGKFYWQPSSTS